MTIKQHGGVFGRNPKFNSIEVESLSIAGNVVPDASTILVDGDIGSTVQGYDADTAKLDVAQTFTAAQTFNENIIMANTKGIDFSATGDGPSVDDEVFSDYEEGTYTPELLFGTNVSYSNQAGTYTKIGNTVFVEIDITATFSSDASAVQITLPFAPGGSDRACTVGYNTDQTAMFGYSSSATTPQGAELTSSTVRITGANGNFIIYSESSSNGRLTMAIMYRIA